jgi:uncharacterized protein with gpF-like domain
MSAVTGNLTLRNRVLIAYRLLAYNAAVAPDTGRDPRRLELAKAHYDKRKRVIAKFQVAIDRHLSFAKHEMLRNLEEHANLRGLAVNAADAGGVGIDIMFDRQRFTDGLLIALRNESADALQVAAEELLEEIGYTDPWSMPDPIVRGFIETRQNLLSGVPDEVFTAIENEISAGVQAGESIQQLAKRITTGFENVSRSRATTIASTETGAAYGFSRQHAMEHAGVKHKNWLTSHLPNVRLAHWQAELNPENQRIPIDQPFNVGGEELMYPGDENGSAENVINCHCVALAAP